MMLFFLYNSIFSYLNNISLKHQRFLTQLINLHTMGYKDCKSLIYIR